ncbi:protein of unassigned function [Methylobacterium oryzae CBMB20]|uniref:Protein of unassigned function n=2 Tax=Methylobacterium oryzae TaxID=334852 RepID=A0A089NPV5_9HYPH|nr:protein of unassigned function [Methylobacterium oryzae CBMB20]
MLLGRTIVPWAILWLWFFEDWLATGEWRGGGVHVSPDIEAEIMANSPGLSEVLHSGKEAA